MGLILGTYYAHGDAVAREPARQRHLAELTTDPRWHYRFKLVTVTHVPGLPAEPRFSGQVAAAELPTAALRALSAPATASAMFSISKQDALDHAHWNATTGRLASPSVPSYSNARWRVPQDVDTDVAATAWVELQHAIVETAGATHGVIVTGTNEHVVRAEIWLSLTSIDGTLMHPRPHEISAYAAQAQHLGDRYVRRPRWGTYLKPAHVAAIGGRTAIEAKVDPPILRAVGDLLYVQLSERVSEATSEPARARFRAFVELLAPITLPGCDSAKD